MASNWREEGAVVASVQGEERNRGGRRERERGRGMEASVREEGPAVVSMVTWKVIHRGRDCVGCEMGEVEGKGLGLIKIKNILDIK